MPRQLVRKCASQKRSVGSRFVRPARGGRPATLRPRSSCSPTHLLAWCFATTRLLQPPTSYTPHIFDPLTTEALAAALPVLAHPGTDTRFIASPSSLPDLSASTTTTLILDVNAVQVVPAPEEPAPLQLLGHSPASSLDVPDPSCPALAAERFSLSRDVSDCTHRVADGIDRQQS